MAETTSSAALNTKENDLLIAVFKNTNGTIDFQGVADAMDISSASAAGKRIKRLMDKISPEQDFLCGMTLGTGKASETPKNNRRSSNVIDDLKVHETPKAPATPRSGSKRKAKEVDHASDNVVEEVVVNENNNTDDTPTKTGTQGADEDAPSSTKSKKKARTTKQASPKAAKAPRASKAKAEKTPKKGKGSKAVETPVLNDVEDTTTEATNGNNMDTNAANGTKVAPAATTLPTIPEDEVTGDSPDNIDAVKTEESDHAADGVVVDNETVKTEELDQDIKVGEVIDDDKKAVEASV